MEQDIKDGRMLKRTLVMRTNHWVSPAQKTFVVLARWLISCNGSINVSERPQALGRVRTYSSPTPSTQRDDVQTPLPSGEPPAYDADPSNLPFNSMRISDPVPRPGSSMSQRPRADPYPRDPIPRSASSMSHHPRGPVNQRHANTLPPIDQFGHLGPPQIQPSNGFPPGGAPYPGSDAQSVYSMRSGRTSGYENGEGTQGYDDNAPSDGYRQPPQSVYQPTPPMGYGRPPPPGHFQQQYAPPPRPQQQYDPLYAAASDLLGLPPGAAPPMPPNQPSGSPNYPSQYPPQQDPSMYYNNSPRPPPPAPSSYLQPDQSQLRREPSTSTFQSGISGGSTVDQSGPGPMMNRMPPRPTTKVVDLSQPPYTKEYVDQYRARLKGDPDPESHFQFAKYLIEAAKKIGAGSTDQRAVRKYRDQLVAESIKVIRRLATQGETYPDAQFFLANCYGTGMLGLDIDHEKAYHLYVQASKQNHAQGCYRVAVCNEVGAGTKRDHQRAFAFYRKAASLGDTAAMYKLGMILLTGLLSQPKSPRDAVPWLRRAAEQADEENPHALHELGLLHELPENTTGIIIHDEAYAKELFIRAGQLGYTQSQFKLGHCYEYGTLGCPLDPKRSIAWYTKAAMKGDSEAELALSGWYLTGSEGVLQQSDSEAYLWARKAANKGLSKAEYAVGYYSEMGIGVKQDMELARRWYMRAAGSFLCSFRSCIY